MSNRLRKLVGGWPYPATRTLICSKFERMVDYVVRTQKRFGSSIWLWWSFGQEGTAVTVIDDRELSICRPVRGLRSSGGPSDRPVGMRPPVVRRQRPSRNRPVIAPMPYRGSGIAVSRAVHKPKQVTAGVTIALSALSAFITVWLGLLAHFSGTPVSADIPDRLAVVQVQAGETLERLAGRVAPDMPAGQVMQRIRELNELGSGSVEAGQTLISPIG